MAKLELDIPDDLQTRLQQEADRTGLTVPALATRRLLETCPEPVREPEAGSLFDYLKDFIGIVGDGSGTKDYAERHSEVFAEHVAQKHKDGHL
jgi:hypothetical protein